MEYKNYSLQELLENAHFQQWVEQPDPCSNAFWQAWIRQHTDTKEVLEQAKQILLFLLAQKNEELSWEEIQKSKLQIKKLLP